MTPRRHQMRCGLMKNTSLEQRRFFRNILTRSQNRFFDAPTSSNATQANEKTCRSQTATYNIAPKNTTFRHLLLYQTYHWPANSNVSEASKCLHQVKARKFGIAPSSSPANQNRLLHRVKVVKFIKYIELSIKNVGLGGA